MDAQMAKARSEEITELLKHIPEETARTIRDMLRGIALVNELKDQQLDKPA